MSALIPDQQQRSAAAGELESSAFIEAGAGTGKSTTLVRRIQATVTADPGVPMASIAAITFTDRAAAELRTRLRERLQTELDSSANPRIEQALAELDSAAVGTIHSLAQRILRTHALSAGLPPGFTVATAAEAAEGTQARTRAVVEHWGQHLPTSVVDTLALYDYAPFDLLGLVHAIDGQWLRLSSAAFSVPDASDFAAHCAEAADAIAILLGEARLACSDPGDKLLVKLNTYLPPVIDALRSADPARVAGLLDKPVREGFNRKAGGQGKNWSDGDPAAWKQRAADLEPAVLACALRPFEVAAREALAQAYDVLAQWRREQAQAGVVTFDDMLELTRDLLMNDAAVRAQVHEEFALVLVDEFQDTDPVQWQIIACITSDPADPEHVPLPGRLIVVGDPKQAIYSFRGADVGTYRSVLAQFAEPGGLGEVYGLTTNFRSVEPVLEWVNDVFGRLIVADAAQVEYSDLQVRHRPQHPDAGPAVTVVRNPEADLEPALLAQEIARAVRDGWRITEPKGDEREYTEPARFSDVAVLYPARTGLDSLLDALDAAGVPYRSGDAGLVFNRPTVLGLLAAVAAIDDGQRQLDLWMALKSPLFGATTPTCCATAGPTAAGGCTASTPRAAWGSASRCSRRCAAWRLRRSRWL